MVALENALGALAPILQSTGRDVLQKWARGELDARRAARDLDALSIASKAIPKAAPGGLGNDDRIQANGW